MEFASPDLSGQSQLIAMRRSLVLSWCGLAGVVAVVGMLMCGLPPSSMPLRFHDWPQAVWAGRRMPWRPSGRGGAKVDICPGVDMGRDMGGVFSYLAHACAYAHEGWGEVQINRMLVTEPVPATYWLRAPLQQPLEATPWQRARQLYKRHPDWNFRDHFPIRPWTND